MVMTMRKKIQGTLVVQLLHQCDARPWGTEESMNRFQGRMGKLKKGFEVKRRIQSFQRSEMK